MTLRAGGLVPIARQYPAAREFVESYRKEFPGADLSYQTAQGYGACQILLEGIRRAGSLDGDVIRDVILKMDLNTVFGAFRVDQHGVQIAHKMLMFQWQDGKKVVVWPEELVLLWSSSGSVAGVEAPIRIGASASKTGTYAALGQNQLRGYELCVQHTNERGGVLGRKLKLVAEDDQSQPATAVRIYERLITHDKVDVVLGPYGSPISEPVTALTEKHRMPMVAPTVGTTSMFKEGRKFIFRVYSPAEVYLEGFVELATRHGLKTVALIGEDSIFPQAAVKGASELARKRGLQVVFSEAYPRKTTDFAAILTRVRVARPDALGAATFSRTRCPSPAR